MTLRVKIAALTSVGVDATVRVRWEPEEVAPGVFRMPLPYPHGSSVNAYLVPGPEGALMIDAGHRSEAAEEALDSQLQLLGLRREDIRRLLVTHADHDHDGFARPLQALGARVLVHARELERGPLWYGSGAWLAANGYPGSPPERARDARGLPDEVLRVEDGDVVAWAGLELRLILCPGHTPGLLCALEERRRLLFSSDHVLRMASPVGLFFDAGDPLADYLASLDRVARVEAQLVLPGHGRAFRGLAERVHAIATEVSSELDRLAAALGPEPASAWEIAGRHEKARDERSQIMATYLVLARLRHLERTGRAVCVEAGGRFSYRAA